MRGLPKPVQTTGALNSRSLPTQSRDTLTSDYSREETNHAEGQDDTQSNDYNRDETNPAEGHDDTQST